MWETPPASFLSVGVDVGWRRGCSFGCLVVSLRGWVRSASMASSFISASSTLVSSTSLFLIRSSMGGGGTTLAATVVGGFEGSSTFLAAT